MDESLKQPVPITSRDAARILRRRAPIALITFVLIVASVIALTSRMKPVYEASASVLLDAPNSGNGISEDLLGFLGHSSPNLSLDTEIEKIHSRRFLEQVIQEAKLKATSPEDLKGRILLSAGPGGQILEIGSRARTAEAAQTIANTVANLYIALVIHEFYDKTDLSEKRLRTARQEAFQDKAKKEKLLHDFTTRVGLSDPSVLYTAKNRKTVEVSASLEEARKNLPLQEESLANLQRQLKTIPAEVITGYPLTKNSIIDSYHDEIVNLETQRHDLLLDYTPESVEVQDLDQKIHERQQVLKDIQAKKDIYSVGGKNISRNGDYGKVQSEIYDAQLGIETTRQNIAAWVKQLAMLESEQKSMAPQQLLYEDLRSARDSANEAYQKAQLGLIQMETSRVTSVPYIHMLDGAQLPGAPISPKPLLNLIMAISLGLFCGVCAALLAEYLAGGFDGGVNTQHLPEIGGVPLLGSLPLALPSPTALGLAGGRDSGLPVPLHMAAALRDAAHATEDTLREIGYCLAHTGRRQYAPVILLTSTRGGDSTAGLAAQLSATLVRDGLRVTLVDADRAQPRLNRVFGAPDSPGLADVLSGRQQASDILHVGASGALRFLAAGSPDDTSPQTEAGLSTVFRELSLRTDTDVVFVSGPSVWNAKQIGPLEKAAGGMVLLTFTDGGLAPEEGIARTRRLLSNGYKPNILGVVVGKSADAELAAAGPHATMPVEFPVEEVN